MAQEKLRGGLQLGGLITVAVGVGLMIFLLAMVHRPVFFVGLIPLLIGAVLFFYGRFMMSAAPWEENSSSIERDAALLNNLCPTVTTGCPSFAGTTRDAAPFLLQHRPVILPSDCLQPKAGVAILIHIQRVEHDHIVSALRVSVDGASTWRAPTAVPCNQNAAASLN